MGKKDSPATDTTSILLVVPEETSHQNAVNAFLTDQKQITQPIFFNPEEDTVKIALVRKMLHHSSFSRAVNEHQTLVLCAAQTATIPAQNALLKLVEEPPNNTQIILVAHSGQQLLATLVSRCREILWTVAEKKPEKSEQTEYLEKLSAFVNNPTAFSSHQLISLAELLKDRQTAQQTLRSLIHQSTDEKLLVSPTILKSMMAALDSLEKNGNVRLVLEHYFFEIHRLTSL